MKFHKEKQNQMIDIYLKGDSYIITAAFKKAFLERAEKYYFTLVERYTEVTKNLEYIFEREEGEYQIFQIKFNTKSLLMEQSEGEIWDLYINRIIDGEVKENRIKSNYDYIRFHTLLLQEKKMFYPYTTKGGNISFRVNDYFLYGEIDYIRVTNLNTLEFKGYYNFPPLYLTDEYEPVDIKLIVTDLNENEYTLPVTQYERPDVKEKYQGNHNLLYCGVKGSFSFEEHLHLTESAFFKFYLELTYRHGNKTETLRSTRIRLNPLSTGIIKKIIEIDQEKYKIMIKPTKKLKYLSFRVRRYYFFKELKNTVKTTWIRARRSKKARDLYKVMFRIVGKLPASKKTIVFESFHGKQFSDSPRAIYEYLKEHYPGYKMYWSADRRHLYVFQRKKVPHIRRYSLKWLFIMARAKYWIINTRLPLWLPKPGHTIYVQTWHGTPLKRLGTDIEEVHMPGTNTAKYKRNFVTEASRWDYLVSPNAYSSKIFKRAFQYEGKIIESGYPRNDYLIHANNDEQIRQLKKEMNIPLDKKVILYAPTWRDNQFYRKGKYKFDLQMDLDLMKEKLGDRYILLLRLHYLVAENIDLNGYEGFVYDFSSYEDIRDLYLVSDVLITDYSSVFFDFANLRRPMIFYVYDLEDYRDNLRGFYFDFEKKAPGPLVQTTREMITEIENLESKGLHETENIQSFYKKFCYLEDGNATKRVVNEIFK